jgi:hypothetical protein
MLFFLDTNALPPRDPDYEADQRQFPLPNVDQDHEGAVGGMLNDHEQQLDDQ